MDELACLLRDRGVIEMAGTEATGFLQRLITNSVLDIPKGEGRYAGLLTPQGKLLFDFFVVPLPEGPERGLFDRLRRRTDRRSRQAAEFA